MSFPIAGQVFKNFSEDESNMQKTEHILNSRTGKKSFLTTMLMRHNYSNYTYHLSQKNLTMFI